MMTKEQEYQDIVNMECQTSDELSILIYNLKQWRLRWGD